MILIREKFECHRGNFKFIVLILFIYLTALCLYEPSWLEQRYGVAAVSRCLRIF